MSLVNLTYSELRYAYESALQEICARRPDLSRDVLATELQTLASTTVHSLNDWAATALACAQGARPMPWEPGGRLPTFAETLGA